MSQHRRTRRDDGAILPNGRINVSKIEREISNDIAENSRFIAEDGMKKRAVHMSQDYNEFKSFVAASQLKPVPSSEIGQLFVQRQKSTTETVESYRQTRPNKVCLEKDKTFFHDFDTSLRFDQKSAGRKNDKCVAKQSVSKKTSGPRNAAELGREWRKWCKTPPSTLKYLMLSSGSTPEISTEEVTRDGKIVGLTAPNNLRLTPESFSGKCKVEIESSMMEAILEALHFYTTTFHGTSNDCKDRSISGSEYIIPWDFIYRWMISLTKCGRFDLNVDFLEAKHRVFVCSILTKLDGGLHAKDTKGLSLIYDGQDVISLGKKFKSEAY